MVNEYLIIILGRHIILVYVWKHNLMILFEYVDAFNSLNLPVAVSKGSSVYVTVSFLGQ